MAVATYQPFHPPTCGVGADGPRVLASERLDRAQLKPLDELRVAVEVSPCDRRPVLLDHGQEVVLWGCGREAEEDEEIRDGDHGGRWLEGFGRAVEKIVH